MFSTVPNRKIPIQKLFFPQFHLQNSWGPRDHDVPPSDTCKRSQSSQAQRAHLAAKELRDAVEQLSCGGLGDAKPARALGDGGCWRNRGLP